MRNVGTFGIFFALSVASYAQKPVQRADELEIPLPITSPRALQPGKIEPLTPAGKANRTLRNIFYPQAIANRLLLAGIDHWRDDPYEWPGNLEGYGMRLGDRMGGLAVRNAIQLATDVAFKLEPRYDQCACDTFKTRTGHAWRRVFIARTDAGGEMVSVSNLAGSFVTPFITRTWLPDRLNTTSDKLQSAGTNLAYRGLTNMVREFWPDIRRKLHIRGMGKQP